MDYHGMSMDPSLCDYSRKNETRFHDAELLTVDENQRVLVSVHRIMQRDVDRAVFELVISGVIFTSIVCYAILAHLCRCVCIKCQQVRRARHWRRHKQIELTDEDRIQQIPRQLPPQTSTMIKYDDCKVTNSIGVKVATV